MHALRWLLFGLGIGLAHGCADTARGTCDGKPCHGPSGLPCRCSSTPTASASAAGAFATSQTSDLQLDGTAQDREIALAVGQTVELTLQTLGPGEYAGPQLSSAAVSFDGKDDALLLNPGGRRQLYRFHAVAAGTATLVLPHTGDRPAFSLTLHVS